MNIRQKKILRYTLIVALALVLLAFAKLAFYPSAVEPNYLTAIAERRDIQDTVLASGTIKAFKQVSVGAQASGQIKSLTQENALKTAEAELEDTRAQLRAKEATLKQSELAYQRQQQMLAQDASSRENYETAEATLNTTRADIAALKAQIDKGKISVDTSRVTLGYTKITAPIDGTVVAIVAQEGQTVNANQSTPTIIKVARMDTVTIKAQISE